MNFSVRARDMSVPIFVSNHDIMRLANAGLQGTAFADGSATEPFSRVQEFEMEKETQV